MKAATEMPGQFRIWINRGVDKFQIFIFCNALIFLQQWLSFIATDVSSSFPTAALADTFANLDRQGELSALFNGRASLTIDEKNIVENDR